MGILDFISSEKRKERRLERSIRGANSKFKPKDYRQIALTEVIEEAKRGNEVAVAGLLSRFAVNAEPTIEDEKEKEWVCDALIEIGRPALPQIKRILRTAESVNWAQRTLRNIIPVDEYIQELLDVLSDFDTEYERNPDRKLQTIMALSETTREEIATALVRFLDDVDETVRFHTIVALAKQGLELAREPMLKTMCEDESIRVRNETIDAFSHLGWSTTGFKKKVDAVLPKGYRHEKSGKIVKLGNT
ncbi:MAG: HEAT repeat domain-containing protein [Proteobacteria bacterium]|nr:HEAT repeat domain-containing protein [Pseudomonadota bacterium]